MTVGCNISNRTPFNFLRNKYLFVSFYLVISFSEIHIHCLQFKLTYLCLLKFIDIDIDYLFKYCTLRASAQLFISLFIVIIALHFSHALVYSSYYHNRESYTCPSPTCDIPMVDHIRRFVHGQGSINVLLKKLENPIPGAQDNILLWSWCRRCKQVSVQAKNKAVNEEYFRDY